MNSPALGPGEQSKGRSRVGWLIVLCLVLLLAALSRADFTRLVETHGRVASKIALQLARDLGQKLVAVNAAMEMRPL